MGERHGLRGVQRSDEQILAHPAGVDLLRAVAAGTVTMQPATRMDLRRLARENLLLAGFGKGVVPVLLPRGRQLVAVANGEFSTPTDASGEV